MKKCAFVAKLGVDTAEMSILRWYVDTLALFCTIKKIQIFIYIYIWKSATRVPVGALSSGAPSMHRNQNPSSTSQPRWSTEAARPGRATGNPGWLCRGREVRGLGWVCLILATQGGGRVEWQFGGYWIVGHGVYWIVGHWNVLAPRWVRNSFSDPKWIFRLLVDHSRSKIAKKRHFTVVRILSR